MPISIGQWRAGIAFCKFQLISKVCFNLSFTGLLFSLWYCIAYLYLLIWSSVVTLSLSVMVTSLFSYFSPHTCWFNTFCFKVDELQDIVLNFTKISLYFQATICFALSFLVNFLINNMRALIKYPLRRKRCIYLLQCVLHLILIMQYISFLLYGKIFSLKALLMLAGDIESNPGPQIDNCLKFFHWNLNSICARNKVKISLIEAYNSLHRFDVIAVSESMLDSSVSNDDIFIKGFSREIFRSDHPSNTKLGGVCLYFREGLPIRRRTDLELLQEIIVTEITIARKKIFLVAVCRSPNQNSEQFENFVDRLQSTLDLLRRERPYTLVLTGDFNCRSSQWWAEDMENPEGTALEELLNQITYVN